MHISISKCVLEKNIINLNCNNQTLAKPLVNSKPNSNPGLRRALTESLSKSVIDKSFMDTKLDNYGLTLSPSNKFKDSFVSKLNSLTSIRADKEHEKSLPNLSYYLRNEQANLGWSLAAGDLNNDQIDDLVISAPVYSKLNLYQNGAVFVMSSNSNVQMNSIDVEKYAEVIIEPPSSVTNARFGHAVVILDINKDGFNDIVVSAPSYNLRNISYEVFNK